MRDLKLREHFDPVPQDWAIVPLLSIVDYTTGFTPPSKNELFYGDDYPWVNISDLDGRRVISNTSRRLSQLAIDTYPNEKPAAKGSLLFSFKLSLGNVAIAETDLFTNEAIAAFTPGKDLELRYAFYMFPVFLPVFSQTNIYGAELLGGARFERSKVPVPTISEQQKIADFLDRETREIDHAVGVLDELIKDLDARRSNTIREKMNEARELMIESGIATLPDLGYESVLIRRGISPAYLEDGDDESQSSILVVNQKCILSGGRIDYSLARRNDLSKKAVNNDLLIRPGDILINSTGTGTLGRTALVREVDEPTTFDSHVTLVRSKSSVDDEFLGYFMLNSEDILVLESRGSTNQIELSQNTVSWLELPLPPLDDQRRIADYLDKETTRISKMKATAVELREELLARRKAIITEYVTGQKRVGL